MKKYIDVDEKQSTLHPYAFPAGYHVYMLGVAGSGMAGIAQLLLESGVTVSGSDTVHTPMIEVLIQKGLTFFKGHAAGQIAQANAVVKSTAIPEDNPELCAASEKSIPILSRAHMLAILMQPRFNIAIAGTHGKTTTTTMVANMLEYSKVDPSYIIGGIVNNSGLHAKTGASNVMVVEADESDGSFLELPADVAIVTNIDRDHLCNYNHDFEQLKSAFIKFLNALPEKGLAIVCVDDETIREIYPQLTCNVITYGFHDTAMLRASDYQSHALVGTFTYQFQNGVDEQTVTLAMPGQHNALNALASIAIAHQFDMTVTQIQHACESFQGVGRRFNLHGELPFNAGSVLMIDDYGHHPTELSATISAAQAAWPHRRLVMVYQPHRYTRLQDLFEQFVNCLASVSNLILLPVYSAGEVPIDGFDSNTLAQALFEKTDINPLVLSKKEAMFDALNQYLLSDDVVLMQGAGDINVLAAKYAAQFSA